MHISKGSTRLVFIVFDIAIKIPNPTNWKMFLCGLLGNMQEAAFWTMRLDGMCPVIFSLPGGFFNVMRRAKILTDDEFEVFDVNAWISDNQDCIPVELKRDSFGWLDGKVVAVDYGDSKYG